MPPERDEEDDDVLDLTEDQQIDPDEPEGDDDDSDREGGPDGDDVETDDGADDSAADEDDDEVTLVSFGDAAPELDQEGDSSVIRQLRKELREAKAKVREIEKPATKRELRPEPTSEDHAFDDKAFKADYKAWLAEKAEIEREEANANAAQAEIQRSWESDVARFEQQKADLALPDVEDAADIVAGSLNLAQQAVIVKAAENPALLMYALSKSPAKLAELAKITDVIKLAAAVAKVEGTVKVTKGKRKAPNIDTPQRGSAGTPQKGAVQAQLAKLEKEVENGGDRSKLIAFKKKHNLIN